MNLVGYRETAINIVQLKPNKIKLRIQILGGKSFLVCLWMRIAQHNFRIFFVTLPSRDKIVSNILKPVKLGACAKINIF